MVVGEYQVRDGAIKNPARGGAFSVQPATLWDGLRVSTD